MLIGAGSELSLIGDPHQGIFKFSGATGKFLSTYRERTGVTDKGLTINYPIGRGDREKLANALSRRSDEADRKDIIASNGAYYIPYNDTEKRQLLDAFRTMLASAGVNASEAAVLCRSGKSVEAWRGGEEDQGQGTVKEFVSAAIYRDKLHRYHEALEYVCSAVVGLLADKEGQRFRRSSRGNRGSEEAKLRRVLWTVRTGPTEPGFRTGR